jgi:hypothetical protein
MGTLNPMKVPMFSGYVVEVVLSWLLLLLLLSQADSSASKLGENKSISEWMDITYALGIF